MSIDALSGATIRLPFRARVLLVTLVATLPMAVLSWGPLSAARAQELYDRKAPAPGWGVD